jgi:hypothetical protein
MTWGVLYALLFLYRASFSVINQVLILRLTVVGDTEDYQYARSMEEALATLVDMAAGDQWYKSTLSTAITRTVGWTFSIIGQGSPVVVNIGFQSLAFAGLVYFLRRVEPSTRLRVFPLLFLPSFTVWTSMATKEALVVLFLGILCGYVADLVYGRARIGFLHLGAFAGLYVFKPHYLAAVLYLVLALWLGRHVREKATIAILGFFVAAAGLFIVSDSLGRLGAHASWMIHSDTGNILLKRPQFLVDPSDVFTKAPLGIWLSFTGPTFEEARVGLLQAASFAESMLLVGVLGLMLVRQLPALPLFNLLVGAFATFLILFATYPVGTSNAGTAIRYRAGYFLFVVLVIAVVMTRHAFLSWSARQGARGTGQRAMTA